MKFHSSHSPEIIDYYRTFYLKNCPKTSHYLESFEFVSTVLQYSIVLKFVPIFVTYCILYKTPATMRTVKWPLFVSHTISTLSDFYYSFLSTPVYLFPTVSGIMNGFLTDVGVPTAIQCYLCMFISCATYISICAVFECHFSSISKNIFRMTSKTTKIWFLLNLLLAALHNVPVFLYSPETQQAKLMLLEKIQCPPEDFFKSAFFVMVIDGVWMTYLKIVGNSLIIWFFGQTLFFASVSIYYMSFEYSGTISGRTKQMQKTFFKSIIIQMIGPIFFKTCPSITLFWSLHTGNFNQIINNLIVVMISLHGLVFSFVILIIYRPYREYVKSLIFIVPARDEFHSGAILTQIS